MSEPDEVTIRPRLASWQDILFQTRRDRLWRLGSWADHSSVDAPILWSHYRTRDTRDATSIRGGRGRARGSRDNLTEVVQSHAGGLLKVIHRTVCTSSSFPPALQESGSSDSMLQPSCGRHAVGWVRSRLLRRVLACCRYCPLRFTVVSARLDATCPAEIVVRHRHDRQLGVVCKTITAPIDLSKPTGQRQPGQTRS